MLLPWTNTNGLIAAMPSLHFGYSFVIGTTIATMPLSGNSLRRRILLATIGMLYPLIILVAIVATANHYILDAVAGLFVAVAGWHANRVLYNLLVLEDWFCYLLRVHKPAREGEGGVLYADDKDEGEWWRRNV
jgi:hypothetical protein